MADNYLSGLTGNVLVGGVAYSFKTWKCAMRNKVINRNNFTVQGFDRFIAGFTGADITLTGPYNAGNMPLLVGGAYTLTLQWTAVLQILVGVIVKELTPTDDAEDGPSVDVTAVSTGTFTAAIT